MLCGEERALRVEHGEVTIDAFFEAGRGEAVGLTERLDIDISNNPDVMAGATMPRAYGLYADGNRLAALPRTTEVDTRYFVAALDSLPYRLRAPEAVLLRVLGRLAYLLRI